MTKGMGKTSGYVVNVAESVDGWKDIVLPSGALKTGNITGLIGFQELTPAPTKKVTQKAPTKQKRKRQRAEILFGEEEMETDATPTIPAKKVKSLRSKRGKKNLVKEAKAGLLVKTAIKKPNQKENTKPTNAKKVKPVQKKSKRETFEQTEEEKSVSNEDYKFVNSISEWKKFNLDKSLLRGIDSLNFNSPSDIQKATIPKGLHTKSTIMAAAETGSGKTYAYALPILHKLIGYVAKYGSARKPENETNTQNVDIQHNAESIQQFEEMDNSDDGPKCLVLCPTRELAVQVHDAIRRISKFTVINTVVIVGGLSQIKQERILSNVKPEIIVATPGRLWELQSQGQSFLQNLSSVKFLVIDEADRMAQKGHFEELDEIIMTIGQCQKFIFSATLTMTHKGSERLARKDVAPQTPQEKLNKLMKTIGVDKANATIVDLSNRSIVAAKLEEYRVSITTDREKDIWLYWLLLKRVGRAIVFVNSITQALRLRGLFAALQLPVRPLHSQLKQRQRLKHLDSFRKNEAGILIATDVAARGLDIPNVDLIVHFQFPSTAESYVHRSGRSARAGKSGLAIALVKDSDHHNYKKVMNTLQKGVLSQYSGQGPPSQLTGMGFTTRH